MYINAFVTTFPNVVPKATVYIEASIRGNVKNIRKKKRKKEKKSM